MKYERLGNLVNILSGFAFDSKLFSNDGGIPLIRIRDVVRGHSATYYCGNYDDKFLIKNDDILIGMDGEFNIARWKGGNALLNQRVCKISPNSQAIDSNYLFRFLPKQLKDIENATPFVTVKHLSVKTLQEIQIPLPPLDEQKRIAEVLDKADALREKRRLALNKLDQLLQSVFLEMFGDPVKNPKGWKVVQISSFVSSFQGGKSLLSESSEHFEVKHRILKVSAVTEMIYKPEQSKPVPSDYLPPSEHFVRVGDLLFSRANTTELVGAVAYVWGTPNNLLLPDKLWRFVWKNEETVSPLYVWRVFTNKDFKNELGKLGTGTSGSMKNISQGKLMNLKIPFPPIELQNKFAEVVKKIESLKSKKLNALANVENFFQSLQQKAFKGELFGEKSLDSLAENGA